MFSAEVSYAYPAGIAFAAVCCAFIALTLVLARVKARGANAATRAITVALAAGVAACAVMFTLTRTDAPDPYRAAMSDAVYAEADEIRPLVTLTQDCGYVTWDESGERALLLSWHNDTEAFISGSRVMCDYDIWAFTDGEMIKWYRDNAGGVADWTRRLECLLGLPAGCGYTHVSAFWCEPEKLIRPAYVTDVRKQVTPDALDASQLGEWARWFDDNTLYSYFSEQYPWTRLGYTYDWADGGDEYGLTEFLVPNGVQAEVEWTKTTSEFIAWLRAQQ